MLRIALRTMLLLGAIFTILTWMFLGFNLDSEKNSFDACISHMHSYIYRSKTCLKHYVYTV